MMASGSTTILRFIAASDEIQRKWSLGLIRQDRGYTHHHRHQRGTTEDDCADGP